MKEIILLSSAVSFCLSYCVCYYVGIFLFLQYGCILINEKNR